MKRNDMWRMLLAGICLIGMSVSSACDDAETGTSLQVDPPSSDVAGRGATVLLTASVADEDEEMIMPLKWSVSNPSLGGILRATGDSAVYESNGTIGQNVVICRDGLGREGLASVNQRREETSD